MRRALVWGKLPAHGDFVARGLSPDARDELDRWLAASLADARATLGDAFDDVYEEAPPWRFAWRGDDGWTAGAMALSVDGVGRRYPILAAREQLADAQIESAAEGLENLLYDALGESWDANLLHEAAEGLPLEDGGAASEGWWTLGAERFTDRRLAGARPDGLIAAMLTPRASTGGDA